jgi:hypothetical protein
LWFVGEESAIPWLRRQLGDTSFKIVGLPLQASKELRNRAATLFPEARIMAFDPDFRGPIKRTGYRDHIPWMIFPDDSDRSWPW